MSLTLPWMRKEHLLREVSWLMRENTEAEGEVIEISAGRDVQPSYFAEHSMLVEPVACILIQYVNGDGSHVAETQPAANVNWVF